MIKKTIQNFGVTDTDGEMAYVVSYKIANNDSATIELEIYLMAGWDYIDPDTSDQQGWVLPNRFIDDSRYHTIPCYIEEESIKEALEENGFKIIDKSKMDDILFSMKLN